MKVYRGYREERGEATVTVSDGTVERPLGHVMRHSPDGFEWGYDGSGPTELARCLLIDLLGVEDVHGELSVSYHDFRSDVIARLPRDEYGLAWELRADQVQAWIDGARRRAGARA